MSGAVVAGWVCVVLAGLAAAVPILGWIVSGPLALAGFILAIVAMARGRVAAGVLMLLASIAMPPAGMLAGLYLIANHDRSSRGGTASYERYEGAPRTDPKSPPPAPADRRSVSPLASPSLREQRAEPQPESVVERKPEPVISGEWDPVDCDAIASVIKTKLGTDESLPTEIVPILAPTWSLRVPQGSRPTWTNQDLSRVLAVGPSGRVLIDTTSGTHLVVPAPKKHQPLELGDGQVWIARERTQWPETPKTLGDDHLVRIVDGSVTAKAAAPQHPAPGDNPNVDRYTIDRAAMTATGEVLVITSDVVTGLAGPARRWFATWYDAETLAVTKQTPIDLAAAAARTRAGPGPITIFDLDATGRMFLADGSLGKVSLFQLGEPGVPHRLVGGPGRYLVPGGGYVVQAPSTDRYRRVAATPEGLVAGSAETGTSVTWRLLDGPTFSTQRDLVVRYNDTSDGVLVAWPYLVFPKGASCDVIDVERGSVIARCPGRFLGAALIDNALRVMVVEQGRVDGYAIKPTFSR